MSKLDIIEDRRASKKDRLIAYLNSDKVIPEMEEIWNQFGFIEDKLRSMKKASAALVIQKKYCISKSQAYKLIKEVEVFSGLAHAPDKSYLRWVMVEKLQVAIDSALEKENWKEAATLSKELRLWMHDPNEMDMSILEKLQLQQFNIQINMNGEEADLSLEDFYKLSTNKKKAILNSKEQGFVEWDEVEQMIDAKE